MRIRSWDENHLRIAAAKVYSIRQLLTELGLKEAGGNYTQIKKYLGEYKIDISHFRGKGWNKGQKGRKSPRVSMEAILVENSSFQSYKLKRRLFDAGIKQRQCEKCGWAEMASDGRIPLELDHINGIRNDNRIENLQVLCPNCHSLQPTHRGRNIKVR